MVLFGLLAYIAAQLLIGMVVSRRIRTESDYLLGGRSFGYGLATFSFFATWFGAETCISSAGALYERGLAGASADPFGYGGCLLLMGLVFAAPLWRRRLTTLADLFRQRFSPGVERFAVLLMAPTSIFWAAAQVRAFGQVLDASSGIGTAWGMAIGAAVVIIYTTSGGMRADVLTDCIQGVMIIVGLIVLWIVLFPRSDDIASALAAVDATHLRPFGGKDVSWLSTLEAWSIPVFGSVVAQELASRALAARSPEVASRSAVYGATLYIAIGMVPAFVGLVGAKFVPGLEDAEQVLPAIAQKYLPPFVYILFAGALVSAILSTVDSTLLAASSLVSHNLIIPLRPGLTEAEKVRVARGGVIVGGIVAFLLALQAESIFKLVENASSFGSAGLVIILVFGLFTRLGGAASAYAALIAGVVVWCYGNWWGDFAYPYLASLLGAVTVYVGFAFVNKRVRSEAASMANRES
jgi:solute:Na+ symporter, SSS family